MKYLLFRTVLAFANALPLGLVHRLGALTGKLAWLLDGDARRTTETNIRLCFPELSAEEQARLARRSLAENGKTLLEGGKLWRGKLDDLLARLDESDGGQLIEEARNEGRGVILAMPHLGCWELVGLYVPCHFPMTGMYKPRSRPGLDDFVKEARERSGATLVPADANGVRAMGKALKRQEVVVLLPDQTPTGQGEFVDFFGQPCYTMTLLPRLARSTNAAVLFVYAKRLAAGEGYELVVRKPDEDISGLELRPALEAVNRGVESLIREAPEQYWWLYKRFRKRPEGEGAVY